MPFWLCVGDVADAEGRYVPFAAPVYAVKGNNENFDAIDASALPAHLHFLPNGSLTTLDGLRVAALGGTFAPTWYDTPAASLPHPMKRTPRATEQADKRRHFVREEVERCAAFRQVDVFLTHEAARPYPAAAGGRRVDAGKTPVNDVLAAMQPRLHLFGHHHRFTEQDRQGVRSVGLDLVSASYLLVDRATLEYEVLRSADA